MTISIPGYIYSFFEHFNFTLVLPPFTVSVLGVSIPGMSQGDWVIWNLDIGSRVLIGLEWVVGYLNSILIKAEDAYAVALYAYDKAVELGAKIIQNFYDYSQTIYQTFQDFFYNTYSTFNDYITNVYNTVEEYTYNTYTTIQGVTEGWVTDTIQAFTNPIFNTLAWVEGIKESAIDFFGNPVAWIQVHAIEPWLGDFTAGLKRGIAESDTEFQAWKAVIDQQIDQEEGG